MALSDRPVTLIVCGAPLAARTADVVSELLADGYAPSVVATPSSLAWLDRPALAALTGEPVRSEFRAPSEPKRGGAPAAVVVCPATFNTVNKAVVGAADSYALAVLCEAIGTGIPTVVVPMVNDKLWGHPAWVNSLAFLDRAGVTTLDIRSGRVGAAAVASGTGTDVVAAFDPRWLTACLKAHGIQ